MVELEVGSSVTPSVPRVNPRIVIPKIGGGYRRYSQPCFILKGVTTSLFLPLSLDLESLCLYLVSHPDVGTHI